MAAVGAGRWAWGTTPSLRLKLSAMKTLQKKKKKKKLCSSQKTWDTWKSKTNLINVTTRGSHHKRSLAFTVKTHIRMFTCLFYDTFGKDGWNGETREQAQGHMGSPSVSSQVPSNSNSRSAGLTTSSHTHKARPPAGPGEARRPPADHPPQKPGVLGTLFSPGGSCRLSH